MVGTNKEVVAIELRLIDRFTKGMSQVRKGFNNVKKQVGGFNNVMKMNQPQWRNYNQAIGMTGKEFTNFARGMPTAELMKGGLIVDKLGTFHKTLNGDLVKNTQAQQLFTKRVTGGMRGVANRTRMATHGMRGFRMEMLGVMFFGMMLSRIFKQMLTPAMEVYGVFELFSIMLMVLFLPIMQEIFPYLLDFFNWVVGLSPESKKLIGWIALLGLVMGTAFFIIGAMALGMGSLVGAGLMPIVVMFTLIIALIALLAIAWINDWGTIRQSTADFLSWFAGIYDKYIKHVLGAFLGGVILILARINARFKIVPARWRLVFLYLQKIVRVGWNAIVYIFESNVNHLLDSLKFFINGFIWAYNLIAKAMGKPLIAKMEYGTFSLGAGKKGFLAINQQIQEQKDIIAKAKKEEVEGADAKMLSVIKLLDSLSPKLENLAQKAQEAASPKITEIGVAKEGESLGDYLSSLTAEIKESVGNEITIANTYNINVSNEAEMEKYMESHSMDLLKDIVNNTSATGNS